MARVACSPSIFVLLLALAFVVDASRSTNRPFYQPAGAEGSVPIQECPQKCDYRCSATKGREPCLKYCNICCEKCLCVPSGTSGNKEECPCYNNMRSSQGNSKCP